MLISYIHGLDRVCRALQNVGNLHSGLVRHVCRALHNAGILSPEHLAAADEDDVKKALAAGLPAAVKKTKQDKSVPLTSLAVSRTQMALDVCLTHLLLSMAALDAWYCKTLCNMSPTH